MTKRRRNAGTEHYILAVALALPLILTLLVTSWLPGAQLRLPFDVAYADAGVAPLTTRRPAASEPAPPPTLVPAPTPTLVPTPTLAPTAPTATPEKGRTYTVQTGDELKYIASQYGVSIWKIIDTNTIPDPDRLRVGQVLRIPDN